MSSYDGIIDLSTELTWVDEICAPTIWNIRFEGSMTFYSSDNYTLPPVDDSYLYQVGEDRIYVEIEVNVPSTAYNVFETKLINVWLCTTDPLDGEPALNTQTGTGGCLGGDVDDDGPYFIIEDYDENFLYNATHEDEDDINKPANVVRFSFIPPVTIRRDTLYVHAQLSLSLVEKSSGRRLLSGGNDMDLKSDQIKHFIEGIKMDTTQSRPYQHFKDIEEYKKKSGFYDEPLPKKKKKFLDKLGDKNGEYIPIEDNNWIHGYYDPNQEPVDGGPYIVVTGDVFNVLKLVTVVVGFLVIANVCVMVYLKLDKCRNYDDNQYNIQYSEYEL